MTYRHAIILSSLALLLVFASPWAASAKLVSCTGGVAVSIVEKENWIRLQLPIPNVTTTCTDDNDTTTTSDDVQRGYVKDMGQYIGGLYRYFVGAIGIIASLMVFYGGLRWLTAAGNASSVKEAKEIIFAALIAILIAFGSYTLLYTINKKLVQINPPVLKIADTFLTSFDNTCPTTKVCLSGTNVGRSCTTDAACPGASSGACGLPLLDESGNEVTKAECGKRYTFKKVLGVTAPSESCVGSSCDDFGQTVCSSSNKSSATLLEGAVCVAPRERCNSITDDFADSSACSQFSIPVKDPNNVLGAGKCSWVDVSWIDVNEPDDRCTWYPALWCGEGFERVGCDVCIGAGVACPKVDKINYEGEFAGFSGGAPAICDSTAGEAVYAAKQSGDGQNLKGICCHKMFSPLVKENLKCVSNSTPPPNL